MTRKTKRGIESTLDNIKGRVTSHPGIAIVKSTEGGRVEDTTTGQVFDSVDEIEAGVVINLTGSYYDTTD